MSKIVIKKQFGASEDIPDSSNNLGGKASSSQNASRDANFPSNFPRLESSRPGVLALITSPSCQSLSSMKWGQREEIEGNFRRSFPRFLRFRGEWYGPEGTESRFPSEFKFSARFQLDGKSIFEISAKTTVFHLSISPQDLFNCSKILFFLL